MMSILAGVAALQFGSRGSVPVQQRNGQRAALVAVARRDMTTKWWA